MRMIDEDDEENPEGDLIHPKDYIEIRPGGPGVRANELDHNFCFYWDCRRGQVQVRQA